MAVSKKSGILLSIVNRRSLIKNLFLGAGAAALLPSRRAGSAELPHLDGKDPAAVSQGYVEDAAQVDPKKYPAFVKGSACENCLLLQGKEGQPYRPCDLFPGKSVAAKGWCKAWSAEI
jgi:High potential iron-sulfur protein